MESGDTGGDQGLEVGKLIQGYKVQMGWYKVPCSAFDYAPASLDPVLVDRGVEEPKERKVPTSTLASSRRMPGQCPLLAPRT